MQFSSELAERGVLERHFALEVAGERVPGILWTPEGARGNRPLVLLAHGGAQHKRTDGLLRIARTLVRHLRYAALALDAPEHGERISPEQAAQQRAERLARLRAGHGLTAEEQRLRAARHERAAGEWRAALDAAQELSCIGRSAAGWWGLSMGTAIGVPFLASEPRVRAAVLGLAGLRPGAEPFAKAARSLTLPLLFLLQWDDQFVPREAGLALYDAFGSNEKSMHVNPGRHVSIPPEESDAYDGFYLRHLGSAPR